METEVKEKKLKGVGGWLLFFIITLTILNPIVQIVSVVKVFTNIADVPVELYNLRNIIIMDSIIGSVVILFGVYAGLCLWRVKGNAVKMVKIFFIVGIVYNIIISAFYVKAIPVLNQVAAKNVVRILAYSGIWYCYLINSDRVKNTYITNNKELNV